MNKLLSAAILAGVATLSVTAAHAGRYNVDCGCDGTPLSGSFAVTIWNAATPGATYSSPNQQALPTNPLASAAPLSSGTYTGNIDFFDQKGPDTVAGFLATAGGTYTQTTGSKTALQSTLSGSNYNIATLIEFSFTTTAPLTSIAISHDDGVSLFAAGSSLNLLPGASSPTYNANATLPSLAAGTYNLWYEEVNGLPATLCFDPIDGGTAKLPTATPEPASIALLGFGLASVGFVRRRRAA